MPDPSRALLRHTLATLAYRGEKALRGAPPGFSTYAAGPRTRTPGEILAHIGDLLDWAFGLSQGEHRWSPVAAGPWEADIGRFFTGIGRLDGRLASDEALGCPPEKLFQGPIADALTHVGQLAMLRRMAGAPIRGENYFRADIVAGRVGPEQSGVRAEFD
jgi:hypothetical protein